jgi:hypothetical protein
MFWAMEVLKMSSLLGNLLATLGQETWPLEKLQLQAFSLLLLSFGDWGYFWAQSVEILVVASLADYVLTCFSFLY